MKLVAGLLTFPGVAPRAAVQASIRCPDCDWAAIHFGDNGIEIAIFLRELYRQHLAERHPDLTFSEVPS
jgi:hypothetical protein